MTTNTTKMSEPFFFFGTGQIALGALSAMQEAGMVPALIITAPDRPAGRGKEMRPSPVAQWSSERAIETLKPEKLDADFLTSLKARSSQLAARVYVVIDY